VHHRFAFALAGIVLVSVSACDRLGLTKPANVETAGPGLASETETPAVAPVSVSEPFSWQAVEPSIVNPGPPVAISSSEGYAFALFDQTAVFPGDLATANVKVTGPAGRYLTVILQRHCDSENGEDTASENFELTGAEQELVVTHTFEASYSCIRLTIRSSDAAPLDVIVSDLKLVLERGE
jgi:hypothetical protein